jgi:hypothetical protein
MNPSSTLQPTRPTTCSLPQRGETSSQRHRPWESGIVSLCCSFPSRARCTATPHPGTPIPSYVATIVGDAVHNVRAALDLLACASVSVNGRGVGGVHFPVAKDSADVERAVKAANLYKASDGVLALFKSLEPYPGGAHAAVVAPHDDLDRTDKHRLPYNNTHPHS